MTLASKINHIQTIIRQAETRYLRPEGSVQLLAVSKKQSSDAIRHAFHAGLHHFGENYVQEALNKIQSLNDLPIDWHFIGPIQRNKTKCIAENFSWVHTIDRVIIAERLHTQRPLVMPPLNVCIEVKIDNESNKSGVTVEDLPALIQKIIPLHQLNLRGLMVIPSPRPNEEQFFIFNKVNLLLKEMNQKLHLNMDTLSMGMSEDFEAAIRAGSTWVRIGQAIFGSRK